MNIRDLINTSKLQIAEESTTSSDTVMHASPARWGVFFGSNFVLVTRAEAVEVEDEVEVKA